MLKKILCIIGLIAFLPGICAGGEIDVKRLDKENWINIQTSNFDVLTNASEKQAVKIVRELENFKYFLAVSLGHEQKNLSEKVSIIVAKNKGAFISMGIPDSYTGVFINSGGYAIIVRCDGFESSKSGRSNSGRSTVLHELVHLFTQNSSAEFALPLWYQEGIAEYYGTYIEKRGKVIIGDMSVLGNRFYNMLKVNGKFESVDTESLFKASRADLNIGDGNSIKQDLFLQKIYARSVAVVHYLNADPERLKQMYQYLFLLEKGITVDEAFNYIFKMTFSELDEEVNSYISRKNMVGWSFPIGKDGIEFPDVEYKMNEINRQNAMGFLFTNISKLSNKFLGEGNFKKLYTGMEELYPGFADMMLQKQLLKHAEDADYLMKMALYYEKLDKYSEAIDLYEKILLTDPSHSYSLNSYAWFLVTVPDITLRDPQRAITLAEKALDIRRSPAILDTLAEAFYVTGSFQKAVETINEAIALDPERNYYKEQLEKFSRALEKT